MTRLKLHTIKTHKIWKIVPQEHWKLTEFKNPLTFGGSSRKFVPVQRNVYTFPYHNTNVIYRASWHIIWSLPVKTANKSSYLWSFTRVKLEICYQFDLIQNKYQKHQIMEIIKLIYRKLSKRGAGLESSTTNNCCSQETC